jgi:hypothetical protein
MDKNLNVIFDKLINDEISIEILKFCRFERPTNHIMEHIYHLGLLGKEKNKVMMELSKRLRELEELNALEFINSSKSWNTTKIGEKVLNKYFT